MKTIRALVPVAALLVGGFLFPTSLAVAEEPAAPVPPAAGAATPANATYPLSAYAAMGTSLAQSAHLAELGWTEAQVNAFMDGMRAVFQGKAYPFDDTAQQATTEMSRRVQEIIARQQHGLSEFSAPGRLEQYMKQMRLRLGLQQADSGLAYRVEAGRGGPRPRPGDTVVFTCTAMAADGTTKLPQLSVTRGQVKMTDLLPGFMEGLQMMTVDSSAIFVLPPALSFGEGEWPAGVERGAPLIFQVTLHEIINAPAAP